VPHARHPCESCEGKEALSPPLLGYGALEPAPGEFSSALGRARCPKDRVVRAIMGSRYLLIESAIHASPGR
jgi:hypothetical protein